MPRHPSSRGGARSSARPGAASGARGNASRGRRGRGTPSPLRFLRQPVLQVREWIVRRDAMLGSGGTARLFRRRFQLLLMLIVVAVQAEQLPVAAVRRIVAVVVIPMVDGQLAQVGIGELAGAAPADPRVNLQRLLAVGRFAHSKMIAAATAS